MVELSLSDKNTYKMNGKTVEETLGTPYDDDDSEIPAHQKEEYSKAGVPFGKHIQGNLGRTLVPDKRLASGKSSTNSHVQVIINKNGTLNHRTVGIAHEFGHVILYLRNVPFSHGQPGVNNFIYNKRADVMSKRLDMTIKLKLFFMFIMLPPLLYGQNKLVEESIIYSSDISSYKKKIEKTIFFDTETNLPVFELILDTARSSKMYTSYYFRKRLREVSTEISYIGGNESLRKYQDSLYWENYNGDEQNASCLYTILFDRKLKIREIKIVKRAGYNNSKYNYDKLIKKILLSTEGSWQKTNNALSEEWYFIFGRFLIR